MPEIPELSDKAASELPAANQPLSKSKGFFSVWVLKVLLVTVSGLSSAIIWMVISNSKAKSEEIKYQRAQVEIWQNKYINILIEQHTELQRLKDTTRAVINGKIK